MVGLKQEYPQIAYHFHWWLEMLLEICLMLIVLGFLFHPPFLVVFRVKYYRENSLLNKEGYSLAMFFRKDNLSRFFLPSFQIHCCLERKQLLENAH